MSLKISLLQADIPAEESADNRRYYQQLIEKVPADSKVIFLPELFHCGFSADFDRKAEAEMGESVQFLHHLSQQRGADIVATIATKVGNNIFNRLYWISPQGVENQYDKRHLFFGDEKRLATKGTERPIISRHDFNFLPLICYDVRFPLWCRNAYENGVFRYDCLVFLTNFPQARMETLKVLARARAIENEAFVVVVNRIGKDGNGTRYNGKSLIISPLGKVLAEGNENEEQILTIEMDKNELEKVRQKFLFYQDWDELS